jgi:tetratricopeptide (TPR) repeat protein
MKFLTILVNLLLIVTNFSLAKADEKKFLSTGDSLYAIFDNEGALKDYLNVLDLDSLNYEANWKAARAYVDIGEILEGDPRAEYYSLGEKRSRKATEIDSLGSKGHLYLSIALGRIALDAGAKRRIQLSKEIKVEVDLAVQYDPNDDFAHHMLGRWHRKLANLTWIEKTFANMFLGGVPKEASNDNAAKSFRKAIELKPTHINHHLELGITYDFMKLKQMAREEFQKCLDLPKSDSDDDKYKQDAQKYIDDM